MEMKTKRKRRGAKMEAWRIAKEGRWNGMEGKEEETRKTQGREGSWRNGERVSFGRRG